VNVVLRSTSPLLLGMAVLMLGAGLQGTLIGVRATLEGFSALVTGAIMACYYVGYVGGSIAAPSLIERVGHVRVFAALASIASALILVQALLVTPAHWSVLRALSGFCFAGIYVVAESWLNDRSEQGSRGAVLGAYMVTLYVGLALGQFLLETGDPRATTLFMLVAILISTAAVPLALSAQSAPSFTLPQRTGLRELLRLSPLGVVGVFVSGALSATFLSLGPVYAARVLPDTRAIATFMALGMLVAVTAQMPLGRWSDRTDRRTVLVAVGSVASLATLGALLSPSGWGMMLAAALQNGASLTIYPLATAHVNDHLRPTQLVAASGTLILVNGTGAVLGPLLVGAVIHVTGSGSYTVALALMHVVFLGYVVWRKTRTSPIPSDEKAPFVAAQPQMIPTGHVVASELAASAAETREADRH
jgi:MFS family permease